MLIRHVQCSLINIQYETFSINANSDLFDHAFSKIMYGILITNAPYFIGKFMLHFMSSLIFMHTPCLLCNSMYGNVAGWLPLIVVTNCEGHHRQPDNTPTLC